MEVSTSKSKGMANSRDQEVRTAVRMCGEVLEDVDHFKYLGSILNRDGISTQEIRARIAQATAALAKLNPILQSKKISLPVKVKLYKSLIVSTFLYGCESWTITAETELTLTLPVCYSSWNLGGLVIGRYLKRRDMQVLLCD